MRVFTFVLAAGAATMVAGAAPLSPYTSLVGCTAASLSTQDPAICSIVSGGASASASATVPFSSVTASAFSTAGSGKQGHASAGMTYYFQVTGGVPGDLVPVLFQITLTTTSTEAQSPKSYAAANFVRFTSIDGLVAGPQVCTYVAICGSLVTSFSGTPGVHSASGSTGDFVNLTVQAHAAAGFGTVDESAEAFADPYIFIDPSFPNASLYSIIVSPGVANSPDAPTSAPEPASGALCAALLLGITLAVPARSRATQK
jgi:hypothetical protein